MTTPFKVRQTPLLLFLGLSLIALSVAAAFLLSGFAGIGAARTGFFTSIVFIVGLLLVHTGTGLQISGTGIKLGFTRIPWTELEEISSASGDDEITILNKRNKGYRLRKWHYHRQDWPLLARWLFASQNHAKPFADWRTLDVERGSRK